MKKVKSLTAALLAIFMLMPAMAQAAAPITRQEAIRAAQKEAKGVVTAFSLDGDDDGIPVYKVEIVNAFGREYEIAVNILTGEIEEIERDDDDDNKLFYRAKIGYAKALETAQAAVKNSMIDEFEMDEDDGKVYYDVDLLDGKGIEHEIRIHAHTGKIVEQYKDNVGGSVKISYAEAQKLALKSQGGYILRTKLDEDEYQIKMINSKNRYVELEIDASSGKVRVDD